jgi:hypothetical protein
MDSQWTSDDTPGIYNPPMTMGCHFSVLPVTLTDIKYMSNVIGENGLVFKAITKRFSGCLYIWYDSQENVIEFFTNSNQTAIRVRNALLERMDYVEKNKSHSV